jgi:hypothetical protein
LPGYHAEWLLQSNRTNPISNISTAVPFRHLVCEKDKLLPGWAIVLITLVVGIAVSMALVYFIYTGWYGHKFRAPLLHAYYHLRKRLAGVPRSGPISIVVTDIEGYSGGCDHKLAWTRLQWQ